MKNEIIFRGIASKYFEGRASREDEKALFEYIMRSPSERDRFRLWEREWVSSQKADERIEREWKRLWSRVRAREISAGHTASKRKFLRRVASVAAVTVFGICGAFGIWKITETFVSADYYTVEVPLGEKSRIVLSDGTLVWLNAGSTLRYSDRFGAFGRSVELTGEGYFEVAKRKSSRFKVRTHAYDIVVTGTRFDVSAYPEDACVTTTLAEGRVELRHPSDKKRPAVIMSPGESVHYDKNSGSFTRSDVDASLAYSWTENRIEFDNITLRELMSKLSRQYNVSIRLESESVKEERFHVSLRNDETIREVLDALKDIIPVKVEFKGEDIYIKEYGSR